MLVPTQYMYNVMQTNLMHVSVRVCTHHTYMCTHTHTYTHAHTHTHTHTHTPTRAHTQTHTHTHTRTGCLKYNIFTAVMSGSYYIVYIHTYIHIAILSLAYHYQIFVTCPHLLYTT